MNFFEHQDRAHQNTRRLGWLYLLSLVGIIGAIYLVLWLICRLILKANISLLSPGMFLSVAVPTLLVIGSGTLFKLIWLRRGGAAVAEDLGGRLVEPEQATVLEKQLLNIVAEMAIASGIPAPQVFVLDRETSINAFAAGNSPQKAAIGVTRGCLETLNRDELQGVIGHEFSHILNGDMRLNMKLIGLLHGILLIYILGRFVLQYSPDISFTSEKESNSGSNFLATIALGIALMAIGGLGYFFGRILQSAVSRQREFLADASAVQFTRNPDGLASALQKIESHANHARVLAPQAAAMSHLFFGEANTSWLSADWFATHPPTRQRLQRLSVSARQVPTEAVVGNAIASPSAPAQATSSAKVMGFASTIAASTVASNTSGVSKPRSQAPLTSSRSTPSPNARVAQVPESLQQGTETLEGAIAIAQSLMLDYQNPSVRAQQEALLQQTVPISLADLTIQSGKVLETSNPRLRLPLLDLAIPVLQQATVSELQQLFKVLQGLAIVDKRWSLTEFVIYTALQHRLQPRVTQPAIAATDTLDSVWQDCLMVLAAMARVGHTEPDTIAYAFRSGVYQLPGASTREIPTTTPNGNFNQLKSSLERLSSLSAKLKQAIVSACTIVALQDQTITLPESELLWAIATCLDCPLPPCLYFNGQKARLVVS
ncbi:MAG: transcriptional regulator [Leptolyngbya sp.]|nr:MAG: transcriptional regulator [Leptolyngbya sp.]